VTDATYGDLDPEFECRELPETVLKGKAKAPRLYEVISRRPACHFFVVE
jgi:hypothetical protein